MAWDYDSRRRIAKTTRQHELHPRGRRPEKPKPRSPFYQNKLAITSDEIGGGGSSSLGKGTATLQLISLDISANATFAPMSYPDITVYNASASSIPSGKLIEVNLCDGIWFVVWELC